MSPALGSSEHVDDEDSLDDLGESPPDRLGESFIDSPKYDRYRSQNMDFTLPEVGLWILSFYASLFVHEKVRASLGTWISNRNFEANQNGSLSTTSVGWFLARQIMTVTVFRTWVLRCQRWVI